MDVVQKVREIIEPSLVSMGYTLVQIKLSDGSGRKTLVVMTERADEQGMSFDDCVEISRMASALLDVDDPITDAYDLEVCSPGLDRPLTRLVDFSKYAGQEAKIETMIPIDGRRRFRGTIVKVVGEDITVMLPEGDEAQIAFGNIRAAKLSPQLVMAQPKKKHKKH